MVVNISDKENIWTKHPVPRVISLGIELAEKTAILTVPDKEDQDC